MGVIFYDTYYKYFMKFFGISIKGNYVKQSYVYYMKM